MREETTSVVSMLEAGRIGQIARALEISSALLKQCGDCPYVLVWQSIFIQHDDSADLRHTLEEAEQNLLRAHSLDKSYLPALEELAHYYDAVSPDAAKARAFASAYIEMSEKILDEMRAIVEDAA